jgi:hypothetical protein
VPGTAGWTTFQPFIAAIFSVLASRQRHVSACPSAKLTVPALPWRVAGKLIQVQVQIRQTEHILHRQRPLKFLQGPPDRAVQHGIGNRHLLSRGRLLRISSWMV